MKYSLRCPKCKSGLAVEISRADNFSQTKTTYMLQCENCQYNFVCEVKKDNPQMDAYSKGIKMHEDAEKELRKKGKMPLPKVLHRSPSETEYLSIDDLIGNPYRPDTGEGEE